MSAEPTVKSDLPPDHQVEAARLAELYRYGILDTLPEEAFDRACRVAALHFGVPLAYVGLMDRDRQYFKACYGADEREMDRRLTFCAYVIASGEPLVVEDLTLDVRFRALPLVTDSLKLRFYAGAPLVTPTGSVIGTLCVMDTVPRTFSGADTRMLSDLAAGVVSELELRALRRRQACDEALLEQVSDAVIGTDVDGHLQYYNGAAAALYGFTAADVARPLTELFTSTSSLRPLLPSEVADGLNEEVHVRRDGRQLTVQRLVVPVTAADGRVLGYQCAVRDVTRLREDTATLQLLEGVTRDSADAVMILDAAGTAPEDLRVVYVNDAFERLAGQSRTDVVGRVPAHHARLMHDPERAAPFLNAIRNRETVTMDLPGPSRPDGRPLTLEVRLMPQSGPQHRWMVLMRDVTEARTNEQRLRLMERAVDRAGDGVMLCQRDSRTHEIRITYVNQAFTRLSGYRTDEVLGLDPNVLLLGAHGETHLQEVYARLARGEQAEAVTYDGIKSGEAFKLKATETEVNRLSVHSAVKYDLIGKLAEGTQLTRRTIAEILKGMNVAVFAQFKTNPESFIAEAIRLINEQKATVIIEHLAYDPVEDKFEPIMNANILGLHHLYEAIHKCGVKRVIYASSSHVVGYYKTTDLVDASMPLRPDGFYGVSKAFGEALSRYYYDSTGIETVCLRIGSSFPEPVNPRMLVTWFSYDDLVESLRCSLFTPRVGHTITFGTSDNAVKWWDNKHASHLGYVPQHSSADYAGNFPDSADYPAAGDAPTIYQGGPFVTAGPIYK